MTDADLYKTPIEFIKEIAKVLIAAFFIMMVIRTFIIEPFYIPSGSMLNTLQEGDRVFVKKFGYGIHLPLLKGEIISLGEPELGDVVVFPYPEDPSKDFIKRVVGMPGDTVEIRAKKFYRNGKEVVDEPYAIHIDPNITHGVRDYMAPTVVPEGMFFVMGDNRDNSRDSRYWGFVDKKSIYGRAFIIYWSGMNYINVNWSRIGNLL